MTATLDDEVADLRRANAELQRRLDERTAERDQAEAQKTAMVEVLGVINSSPGDLAPVFEAMLEKAMRLCEAAFGALFLFDDDQFIPAALRRVPAAYEAFLAANTILPGPGTAPYRFLRGGERSVIEDINLAESEAYHAGDPQRCALVELGGARSAIQVPLCKDAIIVGVMTLYRQEVRPFSDKQIALLENFAAQAVIAMENARLISETREALDQQTATAEVLQVISSSPGDLTPVFDAMLEKALGLCEAAFGVLWTYDGEKFRGSAMQGVPETFARFVAQGPHPVGQDNAHGALLRGEPVVHIADALDSDAYRSGDPLRRALVDLGGARTAVGIPLRSDDALLGMLMIYRQEVRPFTERQIALLQNFAAQAVIAMENARLITETREALEQQTATTEVLQVINSSPGDLVPVFDAMVEKAMRLCGAAHGALRTFDGEALHLVAMHGAADLVARVRQTGPIRPQPGSPYEPLVRGERIVHVVDARDSIAYQEFATSRERVDALCIRTFLAVALSKDGTLLGALSIFRQEVRPFTDREIALLQNFAAQAVIAMENARLITETREALEQQTATAEVLGVINSSPGDLQPVFDAMLEKAHALCGIDHGVFGTFDGERFRAVATRGLAEALDSMVRQPFVASPGSPHEQLMRGAAMVRIDDLTADTEWQHDDPKRLTTLATGIRAMAFVPLRKDSRLLGFFTANRREARPFSDKEIALLQNFAAQAVIAMENARLITETRETLEQQTATAEVLGVINSSPGDLTPVFDAILEKAHTLCGAAHGSLQLYDGENLHAVAATGVSSAFADILRRGYRAAASPASRELMAGSPFTHILDCTQVDHPVFRSAAELAGMRTVLFVPLRKDDAFLGLISAARLEVSPFSDKQIALLQNFAAQAVIAIENARLITETREALEQQTATAEVLGVINSSPGDLAPVFDAMLEKAMRLCDAAFGALATFDGSTLRTAATRGVPPEYARFRMNNPPVYGPKTAPGRFIAGERLIHNIDLKAEDAYREGEPNRRALVDLGGARSALQVALRKDDALLGSMTIYRQEVRPFTDKQIALLQNFAAQAVIAMENARLITETREALDQQTATAEVLQVINSSPGDLAPVFEAMLEKALHLCEANFGNMYLYDGGKDRSVAVRGAPEFARWMAARGAVEPTPGSLGDRLMHGEDIVHIVDASKEAEYESSATRRAVVEIGGFRTLLAVALRKGDDPLGGIVVYRREVRPFTGKQIALLQNFAAQAVIAMENARLITETREALEQQTATAEVLQVINSSPGDLAPVFDAMLEKACLLCEAEIGTLWTYDGGHMHASASRGAPPAYAEFLKQQPAHPISGEHQRLLSGEHFIQTPDVTTTETYKSGHAVYCAAADLGGVRTFLGVPLRKDEKLLGHFGIYRQEVRLFTDKQIALLENFAAQAVIAMENARLLGELQQRTDDLQESLEYQTATSDVLKVMSGSAFELAPVLQTVVSTAVRLCRADQATIYRLEDGEYRWAADHSLAPDYERIERNVRIRPGAGTLVGRVALSRDTVQILDAWTDPLYEVKEDARIGGVHTMLGVPLLREGLPIGVIGLARRIIEPYTEKEIELVRTFADQAVIAIENARLLSEIRQRQAELRTTFDNMADGVVMFDEDLRLAAWNRNFQELLDLPDAVLAERPSYAEYLRILAERGEFGTDDIEAELSRRLERTDQEFRMERTRPDGRVIEVRRNAVPDGGFVLIYSDITERKRSEAEIRAARDAAEATLRDLRAAQANLIQAEKMASLGQLTAGIAHEIKNPLNFVNNFADLSGELLKELQESAAPGWAALDDDKRAEIDETMVMLTSNLEKIGEHGRRADGIVKSMLEHSRGVTSERRVVDLNNLIEEALNLAYHGARAQDQTFNITMDRDFDRDLARIELVPQEMNRVFINLFGNGFYAASKRQRDSAETEFQPTLTVATRDLGEAVEVRVRDNGIGIPADIKDKLFQPFFTTKPTGEGTGLGLSISYDIVTQQHGGTITVESEPGSFTEFTVRLPRNSQTTSTGAVA